MHEKHALTTSGLPDPSDSKAVFAFAMTFNGYEYFGSSDAAYAAARERRRASLIDIRNELFLAARASRHAENEDYMHCYRELLPIFERMIASHDSTNP